MRVARIVGFVGWLAVLFAGWWLTATPRREIVPAGRVVFDDAPAMLTDQIARELYDLEANEVMGAASGERPSDSIPALGTAAAA
jgi:hypothetical protein